MCWRLRNTGYPWSQREISVLTDLLCQGASVGTIAYKLGRATSAIRLKKRQTKLDLKKAIILHCNSQAKLKYSFGPTRQYFRSRKAKYFV